MKKEVVFIQWIDFSHGSGGWQEAAARRNRDPITCYSVGRVISDDDKSIVLAGSWSEEDAASIQGGIRIPKVCIQKRIKIAVAK